MSGDLPGTIITADNLLKKSSEEVTLAPDLGKPQSGEELKHLIETTEEEVDVPKSLHLATKSSKEQVANAATSTRLNCKSENAAKNPQEEVLTTSMLNQLKSQVEDATKSRPMEEDAAVKAKDPPNHLGQPSDH